MFSRITASNLFSWERLDYQIGSGVTQITGFNYDDNTSEGSGKSSIPNILCWTLYGRIPKSARIDDIIRQGSDSGRSTVFLLSGGSITRSRHPNDLYLKDASGKVIKGKDAKDTQTLINAYIGLDFEAFCQSIYFAQNYPKKFITSNELEKSAILSEIQDLTVFDKARKRTLELIASVSSEISKMGSDFSKLGIQIEADAIIVDNLKKMMSSFDSEKASKVSRLRDKVSKIVVELISIEGSQDTQSYIQAKNIELEEKEKSIKDLRLLGKQLNDALNEIKLSNSEKIKIVSNLKDVEKEIENVKYEIKSHTVADHYCPICYSVLTEEGELRLSEMRIRNMSLLEGLMQDRLSIMEALESFKEKDSTELIQNLQECSGKTEALLLEKSRIEKEIARLDRAELDKMRLYGDLKSLEAEINLETNRKCNVDENLINSKEEMLSSQVSKLDVLELQLQEKIKELSKLELLKDGFKEIKSHIFQGLLEELSRKSTEYTQELFELPISIRFFNEDEEGNVSKILTEVTLDGITRPLAMFSGGQGRRIEIGTSLALADLIESRSSKDISFRILDEPMKDLSESSQEKVVELLRKLPGTTIIIEHSPVTKAIVNETFHVEYREGVSKHGSKSLEMP
jgi:DNA repair exonuclease SbcCD ATPase subunit